jgi:hypothetical protein
MLKRLRAAIANELVQHGIPLTAKVRDKHAPFARQHDLGPTSGPAAAVRLKLLPMGMRPEFCLRASGRLAKRGLSNGDSNLFRPAVGNSPATTAARHDAFQFLPLSEGGSRRSIAVWR